MEAKFLSAWWDIWKVKPILSTENILVKVRAYNSWHHKWVKPKESLFLSADKQYSLNLFLFEANIILFLVLPFLANYVNVLNNHNIKIKQNRQVREHSDRCYWSQTYNGFGIISPIFYFKLNVRDI